MRLQDKVTIVTGAGAGIGRAIATVAAAQGAIVVVTDVFGEAAYRPRLAPMCWHCCALTAPII